MYDMDNDGVISKNELLAFLTLMVGDNISQVHLNLYSIIFRIKITLSLFSGRIGANSRPDGLRSRSRWR